MSDDGSATIAKWQRKLERLEDGDRKAKKGMKEAIKEAMQEEDTHRNIARELLNARQGGTPIKERAAYGDDGEVITGYSDDRPWERE